MKIIFLGSVFSVRSIQFIDVDYITIVFIDEEHDRMVTMNRKEFLTQVKVWVGQL